MVVKFDTDVRCKYNLDQLTDTYTCADGYRRFVLKRIQ